MRLSCDSLHIRAAAKSVLQLLRNERRFIMKYSAKNPCLSYIIDQYRTGKYGEESCESSIKCSECTADIIGGDQYYDVDGVIFCMNCHEAADECIIDKEREQYLFEM